MISVLALRASKKLELWAGLVQEKAQYALHSEELLKGSLEV